jgi:hypothetical protein
MRIRAPEAQSGPENDAAFPDLGHAVFFLRAKRKSCERFVNAVLHSKNQQRTEVGIQALQGRLGDPFRNGNERANPANLNRRVGKPRMTPAHQRTESISAILGIMGRGEHRMI